MTITATIRNYRRVEHAEITCAPTALLTGVNASGKSSVAEAIQACLTGTTIAKRLEVTKKDVGQIIHAGADAGSARLTGPEGEARVSWPECEFTNTGSAPPRASAFAAGVTSLDQIEAKDRPAALEPYLRAQPVYDDLLIEMQERFSEDSIAAIWKEIEAKGWDSAAASYETTRRDASRDWQKVTGTTWGSDKATKWKPEGWPEALDDMTVEQIEHMVGEARVAVERAVGQRAVDDAKLTQLRDRADRVEPLRTAVVDYEKKATAAATKLKAIEEERKALPAPDSGGEGLVCPHCQNRVRVQGALLVKAEPVDPAETKARRIAIAAADGSLSNAQQVKGQAERDLNMAQVALRDCEAAVSELETLAPGGSGSAEAMQQARTDLALRESELAMLRRINEAKALYRQWVRADLLVKALAPTGLRAKKLGKAVDLFNSAVLAPLCEVAGWPAVTLTEALVPRLGERPYSLLSGGHLYRMRAVLQVAMAKIDGSAMVVFDAADVLDAPGRNNLMALLTHSGIPAVVTMTLKREQAPDLSRAGLGQTWWLEDGRTQPLAAQQEAA